MAGCPDGYIGPTADRGSGSYRQPVLACQRNPSNMPTKCYFVYSDLSSVEEVLGDLRPTGYVKGDGTTNMTISIVYIVISFCAMVIAISDQARCLSLVS